MTESSSSSASIEAIASEAVHHRPRVLSFGFTRDLWAGPDAPSDTWARLSSYAQRVERYDVVAHSLVGHGLTPELPVAPNFTAHATAGKHSVDSFRRLVRIGDQLIVRHGHNVIQAQDPVFTGFAALLLARRHGLPLVVCSFGINPFDRFWKSEALRNRALAPIAKYVLRSADSIIVDSLKSLRSMQRHLPNARLHLKPLFPADLEVFGDVAAIGRLRKELLGDNFDRIVLMIGWVTRQKNYAMAIEIARKLVDQRPATRFVVIGDGNLLARLRRRAAAAGLEHHFIWAGQRSRSEIRVFYRAADAFLLTSLFEGFPRVLMEAAACGLPIVTTDVGGAEEIVEHGRNGFIVPINDVDAACEGLLFLANDQETASEWGRRSRERVLKLTQGYDGAGSQVAIWEALTDVQDGA